MEIRWLDDCEIDIVDNFDEDQDGIIDSSIVKFNKGNIDDVDIIEDKEDTVDMQFGDGSMAYTVPKEWFEEVK